MNPSPQDRRFLHCQPLHASLNTSGGTRAKGKDTSSRAVATISVVQTNTDLGPTAINPLDDSRIESHKPCRPLSAARATASPFTCTAWSIGCSASVLNYSINGPAIVPRPRHYNSLPPSIVGSPFRLFSRIATTTRPDTVPFS